MLASISDVRVSYGNNNCLKHLDLRIERGIGVMIGPNGVGKSTVISVLEGLTRINGQKNVLVGGVSPYKKPEWSFREVSFLPERPVAAGGRKVRDWIRYYSMLKPLSLDRLDNLLSRFDVRYVLDENWKNLSSGEMQLVSLILCLSSESNLYVLDEPNANIDVSNRLKLARVLKEMRNERSCSFLITSHLLDEILPVSDYVIVMSKDNIMGPFYTQKVYTEGSFIVLGTSDPEWVYSKIPTQFKPELMGEEIILRGVNIMDLINNVDRNLFDFVTSLHIFPYFLRDVLKYE